MQTVFVFFVRVKNGHNEIWIFRQIVKIYLVNTWSYKLGNGSIVHYFNNIHSSCSIAVIVQLR